MLHFDYSDADTDDVSDDDKDENEDHYYSELEKLQHVVQLFNDSTSTHMKICMTINTQTINTKIERTQWS